MGAKFGSAGAKDDCVHYCMPGVPDVFATLLYNHLLDAAPPSQKEFTAGATWQKHTDSHRPHVPPADPYSSGGQVYLEEGSQVKSNPSSTASDDSRDEREGPRGARLLDTSSRFFTLPLNVFSATASGKVRWG